MALSRRLLLGSAGGLLLIGCATPPNTTETTTPTTPTPTGVGTPNPTQVAAAAQLISTDLQPLGDPVARLLISDDSELDGGHINLWSIRSTDDSSILMWAITHPTADGYSNLAARSQAIPRLRIGDTVLRVTQSETDIGTWQNISTNQGIMMQQPRASYALYSPIPAQVEEISVESDLSTETATLVVDRGPAPFPEGTPDIPILGRTLTLDRGNPGDPAELLITIHGVRRINNATALYLSLFFPKGAESIYLHTWGGSEAMMRADHLPRFELLAKVHIVDHPNSMGYSAVGRTIREVLGTKLGGLLFTTIDTTSAGVAWTLLPALPEGTTEVDLIVANQVFLSVPVTDGPMLPLSTEKYVPLGAGWPTIPEEDIAKV
ncbi:MAG: hypothetical protein ACK5LS_10995, partial [Propioniciclava sp.]